MRWWRLNSPNRLVAVDVTPRHGVTVRIKLCEVELWDSQTEEQRRAVLAEIDDRADIVTEFERITHRFPRRARRRVR